MLARGKPGAVVQLFRLDVTGSHEDRHTGEWSERQSALLDDLAGVLVTLRCPRPLPG